MILPLPPSSKELSTFPPVILSIPAAMGRSSDFEDSRSTTYYLITYLLTSEAKANLFFSPPEIPRNRPGIPMTVSAHLFKPS